MAETLPAFRPGSRSDRPARDITSFVRHLTRVLTRLAGLFLCASLTGASCGQSALGLLPGVVNDPGNLSLRRAILRFGTERMCAEMSKRSMPLRLHPEDPAIGRFFATQCATAELASGDLAVQFSGFGYVWTNLTGRITFEASGAIQYDTDFLMDGSTMYVYFRQRQTSSSTFNTRVVERPQASLLAALPFGGGRDLGSSVGGQILKSEIAKGFTVVRSSGGSAEFGLGVVERGQHPSLTPFRVTDSGKPILANDRSELHQNQRDFVGPAAPLLDEAVTAGGVFKRTLSVPPGLYYLVVDNTPNAGRTQPPNVAGDDRAAMVSYGIALDP
jgi:hypothetical protein